VEGGRTFPGLGLSKDDDDLNLWPAAPGFEVAGSKPRSSGSVTVKEQLAVKRRGWSVGKPNLAAGRAADRVRAAR